MRERTFIIAEAGVNHNGSMKMAKELIDIAVEAGADAVKFQTFKAEMVMSRYAKKAEYQEVTTGKQESQLDMVKKLQLSFEDFKVLKAYCQERQIEFMSTPFELDSVAFLKELGLEHWKIPSGEITNLPYLEAVAEATTSVILSTGMSCLEEVESAVRILEKGGCKDICLLHCTTQYPTPYEAVNLKAMLTMKDALGKEVGYSDHTPGIEVPVAAVAMGASVIEKHFTLDKNLEGPDHKASLDPSELKSMVESIRHIEMALGSGVKEPSDAEIPNINVARKSIVAKVSIKKGDILTEDSITVKRPGNGISPMRWYEILGSKASRDFGEDELIE